MNTAVDRIVASLSDHPENTGLVVGITRRDQRSVFGYGRAVDVSAEPPGGDTVFEIGSITKVFTTSLLAILQDEGLLRLDTPVRDLLPSLAHLSPEITLRRLAAHTAGFPRMPSNLIRAMIRNRRNPYAGYSTADLARYLAGYKMNRHPVMQRISYSNLGFALLGHILVETSGTPYEQLVVSRICDELAMPDTRISLARGQEERLAPPHSANGKPAQNWDLPAFAGAGALRSTANDMLRFLEAQLGRLQSRLTEVGWLCHDVQSGAFPRPRPLLQLASRRLRSIDAAGNRHEGMALGWYAGRHGHSGKRVLWHHGATGGYRAFAGFVKGNDTGVVVLENRGPGRMDLLQSTTSCDAIGFNVLAHLDSSDR